MFDNIGGKIKGLAMVVCWIGIIASVIGAFVLWSANSRYQSTIFPGFVVLVAGSVGSWLGSLFTYGFGELIDRAASIDEKLTSQSSYLRNLSESRPTMMHSLSLLTKHIKQDSAQTPSEVNQPSDSNAKTNTALNESASTQKTTNAFSVSELEALKKMHEEGILSEEEYQACLAYKNE